MIDGLYVQDELRELRLRVRELEKLEARQALVKKALRLGERYFRSLIEHSTDLITIMDPDGRVTYQSPAIRDVLGYDEEELLGADSLGLAHPGDLQKTMEAIGKVVADPEAVVPLKCRLLHKDGSWRVLDGTCKAICEDEVVQGIIVNSRDVTESDLMQEELSRYRGHLEEQVCERALELESANERLRREIERRIRIGDELRKREEYFRSLIENTHDVMAVVDEKGVFTYISPSVERVLGYSVDEVVGKPGFDFIDTRDVDATRLGLVGLIAEPGEPRRAELRARHKDGSWRDVEVTASNFLDHPSVRGIIVNYRDITDRKAMRQRLEKINRLFLSLGADLFENMEKIVDACHGVLGGQLAAYCRLEKGMFTVLSTARGEDAFFVAADPEALIAYRIVSAGMYGPLMEEDLGDSPYREADPLIAKYGSRSFVGYPVWQGRRIIGCLCLFYPEPREFSHYEVELMGMLARALAVEEERLAQEQILKDFVDVASHELRHPITLMKGYAVTLSRYMDRLGEDTWREYLEIINNGADRLDMLITELLDASRIERGRFSIQRRRQDLRPLVEQAVKEMKDKGCPHELVLSVRDGLSPRDVDGEKLVRVLVILLDNATAHSPAYFGIGISAEEMDGGALISVGDRGVGIPEKDRELVFERFYQVEDALHHTTRGMGLGLYIAREIVEAHGGRIWHEPNPEGGSIFRFTLP